MHTPQAAVQSSQATMRAELEPELHSAEEPTRGDFLAFTLDEIENCIEGFEWHWPDESST